MKLDKYIKQEISIIKLDLPIAHSKESLLYWILYSLGIVNKRDKKGIKAKILVTLMTHKKEMSADDLKYLCKESRTTILFHLKDLIKKGLVIKENGKYRISENNYKQLILRIRNELNEILANMETIAKELDSLIEKEEI
ncbi:MAG: hypothetical protein QXS41_01890 [Candidatus Woesearchaeota archaeon]